MQFRDFHHLQDLEKLATCDLRHICGFKLTSLFDEPQKWGDINYFQYGLIQPSDSRFYWEGTPPETADWIEDVNGWKW
ncbi:hypothetical protein N7454_007441 [Penicillium verhagenii]|nr:hypothetical protein N7454_007441 [Penicillium verhagenii]